ncbi:MAG: hypothetical protein IJW30_00695 [Clostridia bacterium]|nr:hypothetical protein [Clostridia bacterium]
MYIGIFVGLLVSFFADWRYAVLVGAIAVLLVSLLLPVLFYLAFLPYKRLKKELAQPFLFDEPVQFTVKTGKVSGFFILTEQSMVFLSRECANPTMELKRAQVKRVIKKQQNMTIDVYLNDTQFIRVFSAACEDLTEILRKNGWNVTE